MNHDGALDILSDSLEQGYRWVDVVDTIVEREWEDVWNGDEGENINAFRLGDEMNRFIEVDVYELTPKFEIVEDSDSIKLVEIGEKTNVE